jgi:acyl-ACP thioesterase
VRPFRAQLEYRQAIDLGDELELVEFALERANALAFATESAVKAVALVEPI